MILPIIMSCSFFVLLRRSSSARTRQLQVCDIYGKVKNSSWRTSKSRMSRAILEEEEILLQECKRAGKEVLFEVEQRRQVLMDMIEAI